MTTKAPRFQLSVFYPDSMTTETTPAPTLQDLERQTDDVLNTPRRAVIEWKDATGKVIHSQRHTF